MNNCLINRVNKNITFENEIANSPGKLLLSAFHFHWKKFSGFPGKLENFHGKLSVIQCFKYLFVTSVTFDVPCNVDSNFHIKAKAVSF